MKNDSVREEEKKEDFEYKAEYSVVIKFSEKLEKRGGRKEKKESDDNINDKIR